MALDLILGRSARDWSMGSLVVPQSPEGSRLSESRAVLDRAADLLETTNEEMKLALADKKITGAEWGRWKIAYEAGRRASDPRTTISAATLAKSRSAAREAARWRSILSARGASLLAPAAAPSPAIGPVRGLLVPAAAGTVTALLSLALLHHLGKK